MSAKAALAEWVSSNVPAERRAALSKLVAAFVADSVRADRAKLEAERVAQKKLRDAIGGVDFGSIFGNRR